MQNICSILYNLSNCCVFLTCLMQYLLACKVVYFILECHSVFQTHCCFYQQANLYCIFQAGRTFFPPNHFSLASAFQLTRCISPLSNRSCPCLGTVFCFEDRFFFFLSEYANWCQSVTDYVADCKPWTNCMMELFKDKLLGVLVKLNMKNGIFCLLNKLNLLTCKFSGQMGIINMKQLTNPWGSLGIFLLWISDKMHMWISD